MLARWRAGCELSGGPGGFGPSSFLVVPHLTPIAITEFTSEESEAGERCHPLGQGHITSEWWR